MAIQKTVMTGYGVEANYHKIVGMDIDFVTRRVVVRIVAYISEEMRQAGKQWLAIANDELEIPEGMDYAEVTIAWAYEQIMAKTGDSRAV